MQSCLMELLSLDTTISYQLGFVYIRQLAIHLRAAITSGRKEAQQVIELSASFWQALLSFTWFVLFY